LSQLETVSRAHAGLRDTLAFVVPCGLRIGCALTGSLCLGGLGGFFLALGCFLCGVAGQSILLLSSGASASALLAYLPTWRG
jgi:hypothetical protein